MIGSKKLLFELIKITLVILIIGLILIFFINGKRALSEVAFGYVISLIIFSSGFVSINWSLKKSLKTFMVIVLGGMLLRFILIGVALFLLIRLTNINMIFFISSFFLFYLIFQIFEIHFFNKQLAKGNKWPLVSKRAS